MTTIPLRFSRLQFGRAHPRSWVRLTVALTLLTLLAGAWSLPASAEEPAPQIVGLTGTTLYSYPADPRSPDSIQVSFRLPVDGDYSIWVERGRRIMDEWRIGPVIGSPEVRTWTWHGRDTDDDLPAPRGTDYRFLLVRHSGKYFDPLDRSEPVTVINPASTVWANERLREADAGKVDLSWFGLTNAPDKLMLDFWFRVKKAPVREATGWVDVNHAKRSYTISAKRKKGGSFATRILFVQHGTHDVPVTKIKCRRSAAVQTRWMLRITVPRTCLKAGGRSARSSYLVSSTGTPQKYDYGPDNGKSWSPWATYEPLPTNP